jgi:hypothetical protein
MKELKTKSPLGGAINLKELKDPTTGKELAPDASGYITPDYSPEGTRASLASHNLMPVDKVEVTDPITGVKSIITVDRTGTTENKLIMALANPDLKRDTKDHFLSMYLWERGKENASMLVDLMRYKGEHTKESRAFQSQMRFDFEMFVKLFIEQMRAMARDVANEFAITDIKSFCDEYLKQAEELRKNNQEVDLSAMLENMGIYDTLFRSDKIHLLTMVRNWTEAERIESAINNVTEGRQRKQGYGIYINREGRPYSIYENEKVDEIVKEDYERMEELKKDE